MQHYTTIEQSKKLVELGLNPESADMGWNVFVDDSTRCLPINDWDLSKNGEGGTEFIPCWSLGALIKLMPSLISHGQYDSTLVIYKYGEFRVCYQNMHHLDEVWYIKECLLDAVFEMVCWLLENGYIKKGE